VDRNKGNKDRITPPKLTFRLSPPIWRTAAQGALYGGHGAKAPFLAAGFLVVEKKIFNGK